MSRTLQSGIGKSCQTGGGGYVFPNSLKTFYHTRPILGMRGHRPIEQTAQALGCGPCGQDMDIIVSSALDTTH